MSYHKDKNRGEFPHQIGWDGPGGKIVIKL